jgi:8-oxo-dGTP pyrophosphatase MutT (NUDIX family)
MSGIPDLAARVAARPIRRIDDPGRPHAAVAVVLAPDPDSVLLIRRAEREGDRWSGHLAFPGGRWSPGDPDLAATARRETLEEVGLDLSQAALVGALDDVAPRSSVLPPILVRPFVFITGTRAPLALSAEVAEGWWVPLQDLSRPGVYAPVEFVRYGTIVRTMGYHLGGGVLWGMSEKVLRQVLEASS